MPLTNLDKTTNIYEYLRKEDLTISEAEDIIDYLQRFICCKKTKVSINKIVYGGKKNGI